MNTSSAQKILVAAGSLFLSATTTLAAEVTYTHPEVSIVANDESLASVLQSVGKVMDIAVRVPEGVNPLINCDIQAQTIPRAIKNLLGELSYTLSWDEQGERLTGLTILASGTQQSEENRGGGVAFVRSAPSPVARITEPNPGFPQDSVHDAQRPHDPSSEEHSAAMEQERVEMEARMEEERAEQEVAMREERAKREVEQQERDVTERARHKSEFNAYLDSIGVDPKDRPTW